MLIYFSVSNFRSIRDEIALDMRAAPRLRRLSHHAVKPVENDNLSVLRCALMYGANASGKSNIVKAIKYAQDLITGRTSSSNVIRTEPFKLTNKVEQDSSFYFEFATLGKRFGYGFTLNRKRIVREYFYILGKKENTCVFTREYDEEIQEYTIESDLFEMEDLDDYSQEVNDLRGLITYTSEKVLFISESIEKDLHQKLKDIGHILLPAVYFFKVQLITIFPNTSYGGIHEDVCEEDTCGSYVDILSRYDTGIDDVSIDFVSIDMFPTAMIEQAKQTLKTRKNINLSYKGNSYKFSFTDEDELIASKVITQRILEDGSLISFDLGEESDGTARLFDLLPTLTSRDPDDEHSSFTYVIDEFDRSLHPNISKDLIARFLNDNMTETNSQLIVTTHESNLLDSKLLRRDEIWFVQKEDDFVSSLYSLNEYSERFDKDIRNAYLNGSYGGVPYLMDKYKKA